MTSKDWKEIAVTATVAAVATIGIFAARPGSTVDAQPKVVPYQPIAIVGPLKVSASAQANANADTVTATVHMQNPTSGAQAGNFNVMLVQQTFRGNPMGRVMMPSDFQRQQIGTQTVYKTVPPDNSTDVLVGFHLPAQPTGSRPSNYVIDIEPQGQPEVMVSRVTMPQRTTAGPVTTAATFGR